MRRPPAYLFVLLSLFSGAVVATGLRAQDIPKLPDKEEIRRQIAEAFEALPKATAENDWLTITYREIPCNLEKIVEKAAESKKLPPGMDVEMIAKQYGPMARPYIDEYLARIGTIVTRRELKFGSRTLPPGEYLFGLVASGGDDPRTIRPEAIIVHSDDEEVMKKLKKPLGDKLKRAKVKEPYEVLEIVLEEVKKGSKEGVYLYLGFDRYKMRTRKLIRYGKEA